MRRQHIHLLGLGSVIIFATAMVVWASRDAAVDPCEVKTKTPQKVNPANSYVWACEGYIYLPASSVKQPFERADGWRVDEVEVLPHRYLRKGDMVYFVSIEGGDPFEEGHGIRPLEGLEATTAEALSDSRIQDRQQVFTVLGDYFIVEPRPAVTER